MNVPIAALAWFIEISTIAALASPPPGAPKDCMDCHARAADGGGTLGRLADSVHSTLTCDACHASITIEALNFSQANPHGAVEPVNCADCHEEAAEVYVKHGRLLVGSDPDMPACWSCHGGHDVFTSSDERARVHPLNMPQTCRACHANVDLIAKHPALRGHALDVYESSIHGRAAGRGIFAAATCNDCHGSPNEDGRRTAHRILSPSDPQSSIHHFAIPDTCGQCHMPVTRDFYKGVHGQLVQRGSVDAPVCTHCHGEHGIISPSDPRSPVSPVHVAEQTCSPCHESAVLNQKYGRPGGRLASYIDSYHGLKVKVGDPTVANCASCHGAHLILPSSHPESTIHPANLRFTCGECHPGISAELAQTSIHETASGIYSGWAEFFRQLYLWLIGVTIGLMILHNAADWVRRVKLMGARPSVQRLSPSEVLQHAVLTISFTLLVITGFSLRFSDALWVRLMFGWEGGFQLRGTLHRAAAVVFMICAVWHVLYLCSPRGRRALRDMVARRRDLAHICENILFFLGRRHSAPRFGRYTYMEKCEYWALVWGTAIMIITGLFLWFDDAAARYFRKGLLDVMLVIHYYEAWLATLAIVVWHLYSTVFSPAVYPMNPAWLTGRMPSDVYAHEHPEGPELPISSPPEDRND